MIDKHYHSLVRNEPYIDELVAPPPHIRSIRDVLGFVRAINDLRARSLSCVIDFHSNPHSALVSYLAGAPKRIGYDVRVRKIAYTEIEPRAKYRHGRKIPETSHQSALSLAARVGAIDEERESLCELTVDAQAVRDALGQYDTLGITPGAIGINPGNPYQAKAWPDDSFVQLAAQLVQDGKQVVVLWGPGEREKAEMIQKRAGRGVFLSPELSLERLPAFLKHLSLVVTIDSGLKHLAVAVRVPTVTVFGPTSWSEWHMGGKHDHAVSMNYSCSPCRLLDCPFGAPCMTMISVDRVLTAVDSLLKS